MRKVRTGDQARLCSSCSVFLPDGAQGEVCAWCTPAASSTGSERLCFVCLILIQELVPREFPTSRESDSQAANVLKDETKNKRARQQPEAVISGQQPGTGKP